MLRLASRVVPLLLAGLLAVPPSWATQGVKPQQRRVTRPAGKAAPAPAPQPAAPPPTLEQLPPSPPKVTYQDGLLTIVSQNSTLAAILSAVAARTGASVELPPGSGRERVAAQLGPAPARDVLASLLNGSRFDYVLLGSADNPAAVEQIMLTVRSTGQATAAGSAPPGRPGNVQPGVPSTEPAETDEEGNEEAPPPEMVPAPPPQQAQPQPGQPPAGQPLPGQAQPNPPAVKTPEQLLQELQRMQREQQQQGQPPRIPPEQTP
jgi:hypothetical protein